MPVHSEIKGIGRIIDANFNRAKEGLRVCEEITRFILSSHRLTSAFKKLRHNLDALFKIKKFSRITWLIKERQSLKDVGRTIHRLSELKRQNCQDIFFANIQRVKESVRVLEEFSKLKDKGLALGLKKIRYEIYELEKKTFERIVSLRHPRSQGFRG